MKRGGFLKRRTPLAAKGKSDTATIKEDIQALLRAIGLIRDGGCVLRVIPSHHCNGYRNDGELILQYDHLISRANSATFADPRLGVIVCKGAHGWKSLGGNRNKAQYDALVKTILEPERVALWEACERDSWKPVRTSMHDWQKEAAYLKTKLKAMQRGSGTIQI